MSYKNSLDLDMTIQPIMLYQNSQRKPDERMTIKNILMVYFLTYKRPAL